MERYPRCLLEALRSRQLEREGENDDGNDDGNNNKVQKRGKYIYVAEKVAEVAEFAVKGSRLDVPCAN